MLCLSATAASSVGDLKAGVFEPARLAPDFVLRGSDGTELTLNRYRGKVVLLSFGFTTCTEVCPVTLAMLAQARKKLGAAANKVQVVYVTVDPERDSPERMRKYLSSFDSTFIGATGATAQLAVVRKDYGITATKVPMEGGYSIAHSSYIYMIDRQGNLRALMPFGHNADDFVHDIKLLLRK